MRGKNDVALSWRTLSYGVVVYGALSSEFYSYTTALHMTLFNSMYMKDHRLTSQ